MLAHEVKRRVSALRVAAEAVGILQQRGSDPQAMLDRLLGEIHELEELTHTLLDQDRASSREVTDLVGAAQAAADTVRTASHASVVLAHPSEPPYPDKPEILWKDELKIAPALVIHALKQ